nr:hypothetical protein HmN_000910800 [Hymenolepis microstoma]
MGSEDLIFCLSKVTYEVKVDETSSPSSSTTHPSAGVAIGVTEANVATPRRLSWRELEAGVPVNPKPLERRGSPEVSTSYTPKVFVGNTLIHPICRMWPAQPARHLPTSATLIWGKPPAKDPSQTQFYIPSQN